MEIQAKGGKRRVDLFEKVRVKIRDEAEEGTGKRKVGLELL